MAIQLVFSKIYFSFNVFLSPEFKCWIFNKPLNDQNPVTDSVSSITQHNWNPGTNYNTVIFRINPSIFAYLSSGTLLFSRVSFVKLDIHTSLRLININQSHNYYNAFSEKMPSHLPLIGVIILRGIMLEQTSTLLLFLLTQI